MKMLSSWFNCSLKTRDEVPEYARSLFIETGYRSNTSSIMYCIKSVFLPTNETFNFWTHFIPLILMLKRIYSVISCMDDHYDSINYVYYIHTFGVCYVLSISCFAHMFCVYSPWIHTSCFSLDYASILVLGVSMQLSFEYFICPIRCFGVVEGLTSDHYTSLVTIMCPVMMALACTCLHPSVSNVMLLRNLPYLFAYLIINAPCFVRYVLTLDENDGKCFELSASSHTHVAMQYILIMFGASVYALRVPERFFNGYFDVIGHSHQIFHIFVALGMFCQNFLLENAMKEAKEKISLGNFDKETLGISWEATVGQFSLIFILSHLVTMFYCFFVNKKH